MTAGGIKISEVKMDKKAKKDKKINVFLRTFSIFEKEKPLDKYLPVIMFLRGVDVVLTSIFALLIGTFAPLCIMLGTDDPAISGDYSTILWLISSVIYTFGIFVLMLGNTKTAAVIHTVAAAGTLVTFFRYLELFKDYENGTGSVGYFMPCLGIAVLTITIALLTNVPKWRRAKKRKENEKSPSILGDK